MSKWEEKKLGEVCEFIDGDRGSNYPKQEEFHDTGYCLFLNTGNVTRNGFDFSSNQFISMEKDKLLRKGKLYREDIVLTTRGTVGNVAYYNKNVPFDNVRINSGMVIIRNCIELLNVRYLYQYIKSSIAQTLIKLYSSGSAQPQLPIKDLKKVKILLPDIQKQKRIADILSAYDELIENNNKRIALLEKAAQELYKEWFVRFRFPGHENTKFVNGLPDGWKVKKLKEISDFTYGKMPNKNLICDIGYPIFSGYRISGYYPEYMYENKMLLLIARGVGGTGDIKISPPKSYVTNLAIVFLLKDTIYQPYLYQTYLLNNLRYLDTGAAQSQITIDNLKNVKAIIPVNSLLERFNEYVLKFDNQADMLKQKNQNLIKQRDLLLPRLMSGKLEV